MIKAEIVADSLNEFGDRLTTFVCVFPRIVLAEFNTHRMLSRNSASSRAIPFGKMLEMVEDNPFMPIKWMKEHKGMQGTEYFSKEENTPDDNFLTYHWREAGVQAAKHAKYMSERGLTKQICNRLLEPFMWHTVIVTASEWQNFFALRAHEAAEIHIQDLAHKMLDAYNESVPQALLAGEWHIPFGDRINLPSPIPIDAGLTLQEGVQIRKVKIATARCARVSYMNFEGKDDYDADIKLHSRLLESGHMSPFEHCARAMSEHEYENSTLHSLEYYPNGTHKGIRGYSEGRSGNFKGFVQYRKMIDEENKTDERVKRAIV